MSFDPIAPLRPSNGLALLDPANLNPVHGIRTLSRFLGFGTGSGIKGKPVAPAPHEGGFRNYAENHNQSAYNAPDALSRLSTPAGMPGQPSMPGLAGPNISMVGRPASPGMPKQPQPGRMGVSPFQNSAATMGLANPAYPSGQQQGPMLSPQNLRFSPLY